MLTSAVEIVTFMNATFCLRGGGGADFMGRMLCLIILPVGALRALLPCFGGEVRLRADENALASTFPETVKTDRDHMGFANWNSGKPRARQPTRRLLAPLSSLTVGFVPFSADIS